MTIWLYANAAKLACIGAVSALLIVPLALCAAVLVCKVWEERDRP